MQPKIGKLTSRAKESTKERISSSKFAFLEQFERQRIRFHEGLIFNFDQSGFEYEMSSDRTLSWKGERDTIAIVDQSNKATHTYTIQPVISRDGKMLGKLLVCLQETTADGKFGERVAEDVRKLEREYENLHVISSKSGKMSAALMREWVEEVLVPPIKDIASLNPPPARNEIPREPQPSCSWQEVPSPCPDDVGTERTCNLIEEVCPEMIEPTALVIADSWGGNINRDVQSYLHSQGVEFMQLPPGTTDELQPCDLEIFRQWKYVARRITMQSHNDRSIGGLTSRPEALNMQSLIYNQFSAPAYEDLIRYSWRHVDPTFSMDELSNPIPARASEIQFSFEPGSKCDHEDCEALGFIQCSHCQKVLCLKHFLDRVCFHNEGDADELDFEDDFDADLMNERNLR